MLSLTRTKLFSSVSGGPLARLAQCLREDHCTSELVSAFSPMKWRNAMRKSKFSAISARLNTFVGYPLQSFCEALSLSFREDSGKHLEKAVCVATTNPFLLPHWLVLTKPLHRCAVVALMYDMYPDALEASGKSGKKVEYFSRIWTYANRWLIKKADAVVYLGEQMQKSAESRYGKHPITKIIPTGAVQKEFSTPAQGLPQDILDWAAGKRIFSYVGNMGLMHEVETLESALVEFFEKKPENIGIIFAASGVGERRLREKLSTKYANYVRFIGPQPDESWAHLLQISHVNLVTLKSLARFTSVPSKTYSALGSQNAILAIAPHDSDLAGVVEVFGCGRVLSPGDVTGVVDALQDFVQPEVLDSYQNAIKSAAEANDIQKLSKDWQNLFEEIYSTGITSWSQFLYGLSKRSFDFASSLAALLVLSPVLISAGLAVACAMGRPVFFKQERPGLAGKPFKLLKFRSMSEAKPGEGAETDANRLTKLGEFLRKTSIDELPSLFNILKGELSVVGPRPLLMQYLERYTPEQAQRHCVKPGLTGLAQVNGRNALSWEEKFAYDVEYAHNASLFLDLKIILKTFKAVFTRKDIAHAGSATMPEFMGSEVQRSDDSSENTTKCKIQE